MNRTRLITAVAALGALVVPFIGFIRIGEQGYEPIAFIERVWSLRELSSIETMWIYPPIVALIGLAVVVLTAVAPGRWLPRLLTVCSTFLLIGSVLVVLLVTGTASTSPDTGLWLFLGITTAIVVAPLGSTPEPANP